MPAGGPFIFSPLVHKSSMPAGGLFILYYGTADVSLQVLSQLPFCATTDVLDRGGQGAPCIHFFTCVRPINLHLCIHYFGLESHTPEARRIMLLLYTAVRYYLLKFSRKIHVPDVPVGR